MEVRTAIACIWTPWPLPDPEIWCLAFQSQQIQSAALMAPRQKTLLFGLTQSTLQPRVSFRGTQAQSLKTDFQQPHWLLCFRLHKHNLRGKNLASVGSHRNLTSCQAPVHHILRSPEKPQPSGPQ